MNDFEVQYLNKQIEFLKPHYFAFNSISKLLENKNVKTFEKTSPTSVNLEEFADLSTNLSNSLNEKLNLNKFEDEDFFLGLENIVSQKPEKKSENSALFANFSNEIQRVDDFFKKQQQEIKVEFERIERNGIKTPLFLNFSEKGAAKNFEMLSKISEKISNLQEFQSLNSEACETLLRNSSEKIEKASEIEKLLKRSSFYSDKNFLKILESKIDEILFGAPEFMKIPKKPEKIHPQIEKTIKIADFKKTIDSLPNGTCAKLLLEINLDSEGNNAESTTIPVLYFKGAPFGKKVIITSTIHGNEVNGMLLLNQLSKQLLESTKSGKLPLIGSLCFIPVLNPIGFAKNSRDLEGIDLNRIFPHPACNFNDLKAFFQKNSEKSFFGENPFENENNLEKSIKKAQLYANQIFDNIFLKKNQSERNFDFLIDLHTAGKGRTNSLHVRADLMNLETKKMSKLLKPQIICHLKTVKGSLRGISQFHGINAATIEIGNPEIFQQFLIEECKNGIINFLQNLNLIPKTFEKKKFENSNLEKKYFDGNFDEFFFKRENFTICLSSKWYKTEKEGILQVFPKLNSWVKKNEEIATITDQFGEIKNRFFAPFDGIVIGKSIQPIVKKGDAFIHLGFVFDKNKTKDTHGIKKE